MNKKNKKKGFTLIEILVVVLIIGALSAIALPSYMRSVERSKAVDPMTNLAAIARAQNSHKMANYHYSDDITNLDLSLKDVVSEDMASGNTFEGEDFIYKVYGDDRGAATATRKNVSSDKQYELSIDYNTNQIYCRPIENKTCIDLGLEEGQDYSQVPWGSCTSSNSYLSCYEREVDGNEEMAYCSTYWGNMNSAFCQSTTYRDDIRVTGECSYSNSTDGFCNSYRSLWEYDGPYQRDCLSINGLECETWNDWYIPTEK